MKEWTNPYNSLNSYKGLLFSDKYDGFFSKNLRPPLSVNIDPCNNCQLFCKWCNAKEIIDRNNPLLMDTDHMMRLVDFLAEWGVKGICVAGGGESTLHPDFDKLLERIVSKGMEIGLITNGLFKSDKQIEAAAKYTKWCGISVDAFHSETYHRLKGVDVIDEVFENIKKLSSLNIHQLTYKFLVHPDNHQEIYLACEKAKQLGCDWFHARIISTKYLKDTEFNDSVIQYQYENCHLLTDDKFEAMTIMHKQTDEGNRRIRFKKCQASILECTAEANGDVSICIDRKGDKRTRLCSHKDLESFKKLWGSKDHFELLDKINPEQDCSKCTWTIYQELMEAYNKDDFYKNFA